MARPTIMTPETIAKLEEAFLVGASDLEACAIADISKSTLYNYCNENPEFLDRKEKLKEMVKYRARANIAEAINKGDKTLSQWYMERKMKDEFSTRSELGGLDGKDLTINIVHYGDSLPSVPTETVPNTPTEGVR